MRVTIFLLVTIVLSLNVKALAVASDYLENNVMILEEGASAIYSIRLQNTESYDAAFKVDYDNQFIKTIDFKEQYIVPPKSSYRIEFNITAPPYDHRNENNNLFVIGYTVHQLTSPAGGGIPFLTKINKNFNVKVVGKPNKFYINYDYVAIGVIVLALLLYILWKEHKNFGKSKRKKRKSNKFKKLK